MQEAEVIVKTDTVRVRVMMLSSHELADWHYHTQVTDDIFCLTGKFIVRTQNPPEEFRLSPGQRVRIQPTKAHQLENLDDTKSTYLLVQGIGKYDFNVVESKE